MGVLLASFLVLVLPQASWARSVTVNKNQGLLQCHVCEVENTFECRNPKSCAAGETLCSTSAMRVFVRHFLVSRQCVSLCPVPVSGVAKERGFVLLEPTPLLYVRCCNTSLCNDDSARVNDTEWAYYTNAAPPALPGRGCRALLATLLALATVALSPVLP